MKDRISLLIKAKNLTAAQFADEIGVQKSSISHILSGRNNASLDFIQKVLLCYPEVNMEWLMFGKGPLFKGSEISEKANADEHLNAVLPHGLTSVDLFSDMNTVHSTDFHMQNDLSKETIPEENTKNADMPNHVSFPLIENKTVIPNTPGGEPEIKKTGLENSNRSTKTIVKIVEFYSDNTYREYFPG